MAAESNTSHQGSRILLVDDEPLNLDLLQQELDGLGFEISTAGDGHEALERLAAEPPDLIFLDLMMPGLDGFGVLEQLQAHDQWRSIPVVIISASDDQASIVRGIELGAVDFLPKPFEPAILQARLTSALQKKRLRDLEQQQLRALERELEIGRQIQAGFLPESIPQPPGWRIQAHFRAAREVAGDFYDVFPLDDGRTGVLIGDVTDKGVGAALYMALIRTLLRANVMEDGLAGPAGSEGDRATDEDVLINAVSLVNRYLCRLHGSAMLASLFFAILAEDTGSLTFVSAGQDPPFVLRDGIIDGELAATGPVVGAVESAEYTAAGCDLAAGDTLLLYTDGATDCRSADGAPFGTARLRTALLQAAAEKHIPLQPIVAAVDEHMTGASQYDDITLLLLQRTPK